MRPTSKSQKIVMQCRGVADSINDARGIPFWIRQRGQACFFSMLPRRNTTLFALRACHGTAHQPHRLLLIFDRVITASDVLPGPGLISQDALRMLSDPSGRPSYLISLSCCLPPFSSHADSTGCLTRPCMNTDLSSYRQRIHSWSLRPWNPHLKLDLGRHRASLTDLAWSATLGSHAQVIKKKN